VMDPCMILGIDASAVQKGKVDMLVLRRRSEQLRKYYQKKRREYDAKRVQWAFEQIELRVRKLAAGAVNGANALSAVPGDLSQDRAGDGSRKRGASSGSQNIDANKRREIIREKLAARRNSAANEPNPDDARREVIRDKLVARRVLKQVQSVGEQECKQRIVELVSSLAVQNSGSARVHLTCPVAADRMRTPARGRKCQHVQCFDLEAHIDSKRERCPVCDLELKVPDELFVDTYIGRILSETGVKAKEVCFDQAGAWNVAAASTHAPPCTGASRSVSPTSRLSLVQAEDELPDDLPGQEDETDGQASSDYNSDGPDAKVVADGRDVRQVAGHCGDALFAFRKMQSERKVAAEARENKVEQLSMQRRQEPSPPPEDFIDPTDEQHYIVVELSKPMGIVFQANPRSVGGLFLASLNTKGAAAKHGRLKVGDQLVGVGGTSVKGWEFDACLDCIKGDAGKTAKLTIFCGGASSLYRSGAVSDEWISEFMKRVADGTMKVSPPVKKRRRQNRLSMPSSEESAKSADDGFSGGSAGSEP